MTPDLTLNPLHLRLQQFSEAVAVSGDEGEIRKLIKATLDSAAPEPAIETHIDTMGNLHATRKGTGGSALTVLVTAHMDEAGFMVSEIGENGLITAVNVGTHDLRYLATQRLLVGKARQPGHFLWVPVHRSHDQNALLKAEDMLIDIGATGKALVQAGVGERIAFSSTFRAISADVVRGKAFDRSAACVALLELLLTGAPFAFDLHAVFTTQSVIGGRGASVAARKLRADVALTLTGILATDTPPNLDHDDKTGLLRMGGGPALRLNDSMYIADRMLVNHLRTVAAAQNTPLQLHAQAIPGSEAAKIAQAGTRAATLAIPIRYLGTPNALMNMQDVTSLITLARAALDALPMASLETE